MKLPRNIDGDELTSLLSRYGYRVTHQTGSHPGKKYTIGRPQENYLTFCDAIISSLKRYQQHT